MEEGNHDELYEISVVARLTGLSTHVLRIWEKRYGVVEPDRTHSQRRQYDRDDIHRLKLLKTLVDNGERISSVAKLTTPSLEERLAHTNIDTKPEPQRSKVDTHARVGFAGIQAREAVREAIDQADGFSLVAEFPELSDIVDNLKSGVLDILIVELGSLFPTDLKSIQAAIDKLGATKAIVIYQFANLESILPSKFPKIAHLRGPITSAEILLTCRAEIEVETPKKTEVEHDESLIPKRIFTPENLHLISQKANDTKYEYPKHIANLLSALSAFEEYSQRCGAADKNENQLHGYLHQETANCRLRMEQALQQVLKSEGIHI